MYDLEKLANDLVAYVENGAIDEEKASVIYEAAVRKNEVEVEESENDTENEEMTLESAIEMLEAEDAEKSEEDKKDEANKKKEAKKKLAKVIAVTTVATAAVGGGLIALTQTEKGRAKILASYHKKAVKLNDDFSAEKISVDQYADEAAKLDKAIQKYNSPGFFKKLSESAKAFKKGFNQTDAMKKLVNKKNSKVLDKAISALQNGKISQEEFDKITKTVNDRATKAGIKTGANSGYTYNAESTLDLINDYLEERMFEACSECDPTKNLEDAIDESLPRITPNESDMDADDPSIEKTDKAIEDAKKYLDVAGKLAEMKSAHEKEKDTTQSHEVINQKLESEDADDLIQTKLNIYEACDYGFITDEERDQLLELVD